MLPQKSSFGGGHASSEPRRLLKKRAPFEPPPSAGPFARPPIAPTLRDGELISTAEIDCEMARSTTAPLTAGAHGPVADFVFVAPCDIGVGLFARTKLVPGQAPPPAP